MAISTRRAEQKFTTDSPLPMPSCLCEPTIEVYSYIVVRGKQNGILHWCRSGAAATVHVHVFNVIVNNSEYFRYRCVAIARHVFVPAACIIILSNSETNTLAASATHQQREFSFFCRCCASELCGRIGMNKSEFGLNVFVASI